ncbi:MAG TPA: 16S rRNA (cytidine(1402)-2'-O)-methyltransferase [Actinomycetes bacterium]|nr:16S rRNA (cytidine(1402)-2'-O)-methyltransferase [Actinomycetes bacterium]
MTTPGTLILAATPIGDVRDASPRLAEVLAAADVVAAEDTRRLRRLVASLDVELTGKVVAYHEHSEGVRTTRLVEQLTDGAQIVLVTDAGMPSVSDPGYRLVTAAIEANIKVTVVPGPSAVLAALAVSGLPVDRFCFEGFLPRKSGQRKQRLRELVDEPRTMVFFEAPHRLASSLSDASVVLGEARRAAVCRELTKTYEQVRRGTLAELSSWAQDGVLGEVTLVIQGSASKPLDLTDDELRERVRTHEQAGRSRKDSIALVVAETSTPKRRVYNAAHGASGGPSGGRADDAKSTATQPEPGTAL